MTMMPTHSHSHSHSPSPNERSTVEALLVAEGAVAPTARADAHAAAPVARSPSPRWADDQIEEDAEVESIVAAGPRGAFAVAGVATALVVAIYLAFFVFAYLPRGAVQ